MNEKFSAINSTLSPKELGELIQQKYHLTDKTECSIFRLAMNHLYIVQDGEDQYVFRIYTHNWRTKLEIEEELRLLLHLKTSGKQVSYPIADFSNEYIQEIDAPEGKRFGVLFSYAKGTKTAKFSAKTSFIIGLELAKVHQSTENFSLNRISYSSDNLLSDSILKIKNFFGETNQEVEFLEKLSFYLTSKLKNPHHNIRTGAVHLDIWFDNLHIHNEKEITFFDFDFCGNGYLYFDISYFLFQLFTTNLNVEEYDAKANQFLKGYETVTKISPEEKELLPFACLAIMVYYINVQCDRFEFWTNIFVNEDHLKRMTGNLKRWMIYHKIDME